MHCDLTWLLLLPGRTIKPWDRRQEPAEWYECSSHCVVVETEEGRVLWDTSCPRDWEERWEPTGLQEFFPYDHVTEEQYLEEKDFAFGFEGLFTGAHLETDYQNIDWETVEPDTGFLPGVTLLDAPGRTPGTMAMQVDLPDTRTMIFTSDAIYMGASYGPPTTPAAIVNSLSAFYATVDKIRGIAEQTDATVVFGHDSEQLPTLRLAPDAHYT